MNARTARTMAVGISVLFLFSQMIVYSIAVHNSELSFEKNTPMRNSIMADVSVSNTTELFDTMWSEISAIYLENLTKEISEQYPNRTWNEKSPDQLEPNQNLVDAWTWANETLHDYTDNKLSFKQITEFNSLIAIKNGSGESPRPTIIVSGMIDSDDSPGANDAGSSVSAVLELARVLIDYDLNYDLYFVLSSGAHIVDDIDLGSRAFVEWLEAKGVETYTSFAFDKLLYHEPEFIHGDRISLRSFGNDKAYDQQKWIPQLMSDVSSVYGNGTVQQVYDLDTAEQSLAYELDQLGRFAIHVAQGYFPDQFSGSAQDTWNIEEYNYQKAKEAIAAVGCVLAYMGQIDANSVGYRYFQDTLLPTNISQRILALPHLSFFNVTIYWPNQTTIQASVLKEDTLVYQRTESDNFIRLYYLPNEVGEFTLRIDNLGTNGTKLYVNFTHHEDFDGDSLSNYYEFALKTSPYFKDTDFDGLHDDFELVIGSDPTDIDGDNDGAPDSAEYQWGSSFSMSDTDSDGISDGKELELGTSPVSVDSDKDDINDYDEWQVYLTDPTKPDTDSDGLEDGFEIGAGLNPLSPDSDGDSLSDLFEVLNQLDPNSQDTDGDGWSDAYEVEYCLSPIRADTDYDGIPDGFDWDPQEHWISVVAPVTLLSIVMLAAIYSYMKFQLYSREDKNDDSKES